MKFFLFASSLVLSLCGSLPAAAEPSWGFVRVSDQRRNEVRDAVEAHRAAKREKVRRQEAATGRRLTPAERLVPGPSPKSTLLTAPRSQRP